MTSTNTNNFTNVEALGIHSYLSGMYMKSHQFCSGSPLDEICIDFTPLGYYRFFKQPIKKYILDDDILSDGLGKDAKTVFERIFEIAAIEQRGRAIESLLLAQIKSYEDPFIYDSMRVLENSRHCNITKIRKQLKCSERKLQRQFASRFDITPKQFLRIKRFRNTLTSIQKASANNELSNTAYEFGFSDQSHFNKEIKSFTNLSPLKLQKSLVDIDQKVLVTI